MNWKSYSLVSGAGVLATWFATSQPSAPANVTPVQPREAGGVAAAVSDIEQQANRLQARLQQHALYQEPSRNLFRFSSRGAAPAAAPPAPVAPVDPVNPVPPPPPVKLTAIAVDGETRTAILSTPGGVVFAQAGEDVLGRFRVTRVDDEAVEIVTIADGTATRLTLR